MTDEQIDALFDSFEVRDAGDFFEHVTVVRLDAARAAVRAALASRQAKTNYERDMEDTLFQIAKAAGFDVSKDQGLDPEVLIAKVKSMAMQWRPIETAPKDGTWVLMARKSFAAPMSVCYWSAPYDAWLPVMSVGEFSDPTHWMPLPDTPGEQQ